MAVTAIAFRRLHQQRLAPNRMTTPGEVVQWMGAVQAQDYAGAKWSLGLRTQNATDENIEQVFMDGTILRTHVMRPTWHFVPAADIRWMLELTAPRVNAKLATMDRRLGIDQTLLQRSYTIMVDALRGGNQLTRTELASRLEQHGIAAEGLLLTHLVMHAELDAVLCSGPRRGKQFTYMLLAERASQARTLSRDEALAELVRRYYTGHGPATLRDFAWWSGLTVADAKAGLALVGSELAHETIDDQLYWFSASMPRSEPPNQAALLLPTYDEFLVGYTAFDFARRGGREPSKNGVFDPPMVIRGQVAGSWRRTFKDRATVIELSPFEAMTAVDLEAFNTAAQEYARFLGMPVMLLVNGAAS